MTDIKQSDSLSSATGQSRSMPKGWEIKKLGEVAKATYGYTEKASLEEIGPKFLRITDIQEDGVNWDTVPFCKINDADLEQYKLIEGDIVFARTGATTGKSYLVICPPRSVFASYLIKVHITHNGLSPEFLFQFFQTKSYWDCINSGISGSAQGGFNATKLAELEVPLPPISEQKRIVSILDEAFAAIATAKANAEQNLKNAKELFEVYLHKYFSSKEEGWEEKKLKEVAEYFNGLTYSPKDVSNKGIIVLRSSNVQNDELDFNDIVRVNLTVKDKIIVKEGDILMCSRNGSKRLVGKTAPITKLPEVMTFGTFMMIIKSEYNPYLLWFFKSADFRRQISGGENPMINQITRYMLDDIEVSFPPLTRQSEIVQQLNALNSQILKLQTTYKKKIDNLEELKKSALAKAFSGKLGIS